MPAGRCSSTVSAAHPVSGSKPGSKRGSKRGKRWRDYTAGQRAALCALAAAEVGLAVTAWRDLAHRDPSEVRGRKWVWALIIAVNIVGPLAYFRWGRLPIVGAPPVGDAAVVDEERWAS